MDSWSTPSYQRYEEETTPSTLIPWIAAAREATLGLLFLSLSAVGGRAGNNALQSSRFVH